MSQCSRVLEVLRDGKPHSIQEVHDRAGMMRLNSRISDLRNMGYNIAYFRKDGLHTYQLLDFGTVREGQPTRRGGETDGAASHGPPSNRSVASPPTEPGNPPSPEVESPAQLSLEAA
jgi:hypothetical protein